MLLVYRSNISTIKRCRISNFWFFRRIYQESSIQRRGRTGHAEAIQIEFNPAIISYQEILDVFFSTHDPTTLNRQGYDVGTQYRSAIFYNSDEQKEIAEKIINDFTKAKVFDSPIVTEVTEFDVFYKAEEYHQNYYNNNKSQGYCVAVINPKLEKFIKKYRSKLKN